MTSELPKFESLKTDRESDSSNFAIMPTVAGVIVSYHPSRKLAESVAALRPQVKELVIVDNGSGDASRELLHTLACKFQCDVIFNETNLGIAAALNQGVTRAEEKQCTFVALFDQDSCVTGSYIQSILATYSNCNGPVAPAMVAPTYVDQRSGLLIPADKNDAGLLTTAITSGTLIPVSTLRQCGPFEEALFIDFVDTEYCLRLRARGFVIVQSTNAILLHSLGHLRLYRWLGRKFYATNHSAPRRYYISRNRIILYRRYLRKFPEWVSRDLREMIKETTKIVLVEDDRMRKLGFILLGIFDALTGRLGYRATL